MSTHRPRVLIIDDDPLYRSLMTTLLRKEYLLAVAADGAEGFQKALQHPPDIAIVDIQMEGWGGLKTLEEFRKHPILKRVKIVMLTADASKESVVSAIKGGANDYVIKTSFSREDFLEKLKKLSNRQVTTVSKRPHPAVAHQNQDITPQTPAESDTNLAGAKTDQTDPELADNSESESEADLQGLMDSWD